MKDNIPGNHTSDTGRVTIKDEYDDELSNLESSSRDHFRSAENSPLSGFDNGGFGDHFLLDSLGGDEPKGRRSFAESGKVEQDQEEEEEEGSGSEDASGPVHVLCFF